MLLGSSMIVYGRRPGIGAGAPAPAYPNACAALEGGSETNITYTYTVREGFHETSTRCKKAAIFMF